MFALDSDTVIDILRLDPQVRDQLEATDPMEIILPSVVVYEIEVGLLKKPDARKQRALFEALLDDVRVAVLDANVARCAARIRAGLEAKGKSIGPLDVLVAATALANNATLVTRNLREFQRIEGLACTSWQPA